MLKYLAGSALFLSMLPPGVAASGGLYAGAKYGRGNITVEDRFAINGQAVEDNTTTGSLYMGYRAATGLMTEVSYTTVTNDDLFDTYDLAEMNLMLGYVFDIDKRLRFIPKLGYSHWQLEAEQSGLPGDPVKAEFEGNDFVWSADLELTINRSMRLSFSHVRGNYEFGDVDSSGFGIIFSL